MPDYEIESSFYEIVSDIETNMVATFDNEMFNRKCCIVHALNLIVKDIHDLFIVKVIIFDNVRAKTKHSSLFVKYCETME